MRSYNPVAAGLIVLLLALGAIWGLHTSSARPGTAPVSPIGLRPGLPADQRLTAYIDETDLRKCVLMYLELTGRELAPATNGILSELDDALGGRLSRWKWIAPRSRPDAGITFHADGAFTAAETKERLEEVLAGANLKFVPVGTRRFRLEPTAPAAARAPEVANRRIR